MIPNFQIHKNELPDNPQNNAIHIVLLEDEKYKVFVTDISGVVYNHNQKEAETPTFPKYTITQKEDTVTFKKDGKEYFKLELEKYIDKIPDIPVQPTPPAVNSGFIKHNALSSDDLRNIKNPKHNDFAFMVAHSDFGINQMLGSGIFRFNAEPEFEIDSEVNFVSQYSRVSFNNTPLKRFQPKSTGISTKFISDKGVVIEIKAHNASTSEEEVNGEIYNSHQIRGLFKGSTSFGKFVYCWKNDDKVFTDHPTPYESAPDIQIGDKFYLLDDDGITFKSNTTKGVWERVIQDGYINSTMYGAFPYNHPEEYKHTPENKRIDSSKAIQKCLDNLKYSVKEIPGYYATDETLVVRLDKQYIMPFGSFNYGGRRSYFSWSATSAVYFTDKKINVIEQAGASIQNCSFNVDMSLVANSGGKIGYRVNVRDFAVCRIRNSEINFIGHKDCSAHAYVIDDRDLPFASKGNFDGSVTGTHHFSQIKVRIHNYDKGFWVTAVKDRKTSINGMDVRFLGCFAGKQALVLDREVSNSKFEGLTWQMADCCTWEEAQTLSYIKIQGKRLKLNGMIMDPHIPPDIKPDNTNERFRNKYLIEIVKPKLNGKDLEEYKVTAGTALKMQLERIVNPKNKESKSRFINLDMFKNLELIK